MDATPEPDTNLMPAEPVLGRSAPERLQVMETRLAAMVEQAYSMRQEVARMHTEVTQLRALVSPPRPKLPWKIWVRHHVKELLKLKVRLGKLEFADEPKEVWVPRRYHRVPRLTNPPTISIATPSFNQGRFLEQTIRSVLDQDYPRLEYVVQDGGSTDDTREVLSRYRARLFRCESRKDNGQSHAINLGLAGTSGEIMAYLNSDDLLLPGALHTVAQFFQQNPDVDVVYGHRVLINGEGQEIGRWVIPPHDDEVLRWADYVPQETMFWRRRIWDKVGGIDESFRFAMDWDLLLRFQAAGAKFYRYPRFLGSFRIHGDSKTMTVVNTQGELEMARLRERSLGRVPEPVEVKAAVRRYLGWHVFYDRMYSLGLFRY
ncbi:glycosyltransferase family 2 protein [Gemmata sp. JC717]|uniref:Glycosyltransferase n=1 Tax=Gemmata algarum TaxID=2975278 RepID=A0ABU5F865_9BACT|nr:glycosyltransferase family 2 protein [Gemmata algarum]MDY3555033.1 glycosyltransferase family 2 protein [Gemmata algarum]MDY3563722.1 glycosyltransferase [Gemmata algarum]